jgi:hypothetical protein
MTVSIGTIDNTLLRVAKVRTFARGKPTTNATGFFYLQEEFLYLITARHVVHDEATGHHPDHLHVSLHCVADDMSRSEDLIIPLYVDATQQWFECQDGSAVADVVAVSINDPDVLRSRFVTVFRQSDIMQADEKIPLGQDALILGFPLGFSDTLNNLPIVRRATIASSFAHPFKGSPYFLTDARLHRGMSGSPVITRSARPSQQIFGQTEFEWRLLGVHSSALDVSDRDAMHDERLALNMTWYASLIPEMLPDRAAAGSNVFEVGSRNK